MYVRTTAELGALIRSRRRELGIDQATLARRAGVSRYWVIDVERGKSTAEIGLVLRTLRSLGLVVDISEPSGRSRPSRQVDVDALIAATLEKKRK